MVLSYRQIIISTDALVIKAARAGKHIICEKPAAISVAEFDEMMAETERAEVTFTVHQQRRYDKDFQSVKACYDKRLVGDIYTIQSSLYGYNGNMHDWHVYKDEGGGMLYDWGVHLIDRDFIYGGQPSGIHIRRYTKCYK